MKLSEAMNELAGNSVQVSESGMYPAESAEASVMIKFSNDAWLRADYWRLLLKGKGTYSSFDHQQRYGLPASFDAIAELRAALEDKKVEQARWDSETGDLILEFSGNLKLQIFNFSGYEVWELRFSNGTAQYSNHARPMQNPHTLQ